RVRRRLAHRLQRIGAEIGGRIRFGRVANVDQVVRTTLQRRRIRLGRADIQAAIDQRRVDTDQLQREPLGKMARQRGFPRGGRAHEEHGKRTMIGRHRHIVRATPMWNEPARPYNHRIFAETPMTRTMKALVNRDAAEGIWMEQVPVPEAGTNEVLIKVDKTAICGTDLHIYKWDEWSQRTI